MYKVALNVGIGDIIGARSMLESSKDTDIKVSLNYGALPYRGANYLDFISEFAKKVFDGTRFKFDPARSDYPVMNCYSFWDEGLRPQYLDISEKLCQGASIVGPYICVHTKVRGSPPDRGIFQVFRDLSKRYKIVLIGEQKVEINDEYALSKDVYSMYDELKELGNMVDLTIPALGLTPPTMPQIMQDCKYMKDAKTNIVVGYGGNLPLSCCVGNVIGCSCDSRFLIPMCGKRGMIFEHSNDFVDAIKRL
jgi:hypothetical protein